MNKIKIFKSNAKGFGHIELVAMIVFVVAFLGTASLIYKHDKSKVQTHAAGLSFTNYTYLGSSTNYSPNPWPNIGMHFYACLHVTGSAQAGFAYTVEGYGLASSPQSSNTYITLSDFANQSGILGNNRWLVQSDSWTSGVYAEAKHSENNSQENLITMNFYVGIPRMSGSTPYIHSNSLARCTS
jgi:hypothetical protein